MKEKYLSTRHEPALGARDATSSSDTSRERRAEPEPPSIETTASETERLRDSIAAEPALSDHRNPGLYAEWLARRRARTTVAGNLAVTFLVALASGPMAVAGALLAGRQTWWGTVYLVLFGPVIEELLKQAGMIYLLERKPYRLFAWWQFVLAAVISGLGFAAVENLIYLYVYVSPQTFERWHELARFRWTWCTLLHVSCAVVASLGLARVWKQQLRDGLPAELNHGFTWFLAAIIIHGTYNLSMLMLQLWHP